MYYAIFSAAFFLRGKRRVALVAALCLLAGPTILALLPIWLMGYACYLAMTRYESAFLKHRVVSGVVSLVALAALVIGSPWVRHHVDFAIPYVKRVDIAGDYFDAALFALHVLFFLPLLVLVKPLLVRHAAFIKWAASLTFALYLFHRPLIQVLAIVSPFEPGSLYGRVIVLGGTFLVVATFGAWCENRKHVIKTFLPHLKTEWVMDDPRLRVKGGRSPAERTLDTRDRAIRWCMAGCGALSHPAMETKAAVG
jgi:hypothetical protein